MRPHALLRDRRTVPATAVLTGLTLAIVACSPGSNLAGTSSAGQGSPPAVSTASPSSTEESFTDANGCDLACQWLHLDGGLTRPGALPAGDYTTSWFFPGRMTVTVPQGWSSGEDSTGEFALTTEEVPEGVLMFWLDVTAIEGRRVPVKSVGRTVRQAVDWLTTNPDVTITRRGTETLGSGLVATTLDLQVSKTAKNYAGPHCPTSACVYLFAMDHMWDSVRADGPGVTDSGWAIGRGVSYVRLYLVTLQVPRYGWHLFVIAQDAPTPKARRAMTKAARPVLASLQLPMRVF